MILASDVRQRLAALLQNNLSLPEFVDWIESKSWNMHRDSQADAIDLVSSIHLLLSEHDDQVLSDAALRVELLQVLNEVRESISVAESRAIPPQMETVFRSATAFWVTPARALQLFA
jgi:hypothetical protein